MIATDSPPDDREDYDARILRKAETRSKLEALGYERRRCANCSGTGKIKSIADDAYLHGTSCGACGGRGVLLGATNNQMTDEELEAALKRIEDKVNRIPHGGLGLFWSIVALLFLNGCLKGCGCPVHPQWSHEERRAWMRKMYPNKPESEIL